MRTISDHVDRMGVELAGRYAEWKYLMTDACVISARRAANHLRGTGDDVDDEGTRISSQG